MVSKEFFKQLEIVAEEKGISVDDLIEAFKKSLMNAFKRTYGHQSARIKIKPEKHEIMIYSRYLVVSEKKEDPENEIEQMLLQDAKKISSKYKVGDVIEIPVNPKEFGRFAASIAKQVFNQSVKTIEKENAYQYFKGFEHEMMNALIVQKNENNFILDLGQEITTVLPDKQLMPTDKENYNEGDKINVYITNVEQTTKGPRIFVSRTDSRLVVRLFESNVPEIKEGIIEIMGIAREPGEKTKIGVYSNDSNVEPIGACVGEKGSRIKNVVAALSGEKIEMFKYDNDPETLIKNALYPAKVKSVCDINLKKKTALVIVEDESYNLAIGYKGINKRLVCGATNWHIEIRSVMQMNEEGIEF